MAVKANTRITESDRNDYRWKAVNLLARRKRLIQPIWPQFDNDPYTIYRSAFPPAVNEAIDAIHLTMDKKFQRFLQLGTDGMIAVKDHPEGPTVTFHWTDARPALQGSWGNEKALKISREHPLADSIIEYAARVEALTKQNDAVCNLINHVFRECGTFGQIHRVWPDLLPLMSHHKIALAEKQQRKSSLPVCLDVERVMAHRDEYTVLMAQAAVLPQQDNNQPAIWARL